MFTLRSFYFPLFLVYVGTPLAFIFGLYFLAGSWGWSIPLFILSAIMGTTTYVTKIDKDMKSYIDYLLFLGMKFRVQQGRYALAERVIITKGEHSYKAATRSSDRTVRFNLYSATLILNTVELDLITGSDKHNLLLKVKPLIMHLELPIEDHTVPTPYQIDIAQVN